MPKAAANTVHAKKAAGRKAAKADAPKMEVISETPGEPITEDLVAEEPVTETAEEPAREAPAMEAAAELTDFDNLLDLCRAIEPKFGSETAKEGSNHFFQRILTAINDCSTEQFDTLSLSQQTWYENSVAQANAKEDITPPDGYYGAGYVKPADEKKAPVGKKAAGAKEPKAPKEPKAKKEKAPKAPKVRENKTMPVREKICSDPTITLEQLMSLFPTIGKSTLSTTRSDVSATLKAAQAVGWSVPA